ncbi:MAG: hypothetical protein RQ763_01450 [Sulfurimonas sp.]|uniref:hypothetical protein n=1 Tax=Sulfurimonas sp. TaxID=2022749 RepID=UPI0028CF02E6|nr:hypothetical protein [Sulfurimonas sp.]MDT8337843.1 hypothetical protein [Sulfurimonas sp.]
MSIKNKSILGAKISYLLPGFLFLLPLSLGAISTFKGQLVYLKECRVCHLSSRIFVQTHSSAEWEKILDAEGVRLSDIHLNAEEKHVNSKDRVRKSSHKHFKSENYNKKYPKLRDFIIETAKKNEAIDANYRE